MLIASHMESGEWRMEVETNNLPNIFFLISKVLRWNNKQGFENNSQSLQN